MAAIIAGQGVVVRGTATTVYVADAVLDTDQAFDKIDTDLKRVVELQYLAVLSPDQKARKAQVSRKTFYRRLDTALQQLLFFLKPKVKANPVRDGLLAKRRVGVSLGWSVEVPSKSVQPSAAFVVEHTFSRNLFWL